MQRCAAVDFSALLTAPNGRARATTATALRVQPALHVLGSQHEPLVGQSLDDLAEESMNLIRGGVRAADVPQHAVRQMQAALVDAPPAETPRARTGMGQRPNGAVDDEHGGLRAL